MALAWTDDGDPASPWFILPESTLETDDDGRLIVDPETVGSALADAPAFALVDQAGEERRSKAIGDLLLAVRILDDVEAAVRSAELKLAAERADTEAGEEVAVPYAAADLISALASARADAAHLRSKV